MMNATREKTRLWLLTLVGVVATLLGQTHAREIFAPSPPESGVFAPQTQASTGENYDGIQYDALDSLLAAKTPLTPSAFARGQQGSGLYPGVDRFRDITLKKGTIIYGGAPGQSSFYTTGGAIRRAGDSATDIFQGLQVAPHPVHGYRPAMTAYEVVDDLPAAFGRTLANPQNGAGGLPQIVIPNWQGYLRPIHNEILSP